MTGVTGAWYSGFGWSGFVGWGVILLLCIPLVAGETLKNPIPNYTSKDISETSLHPFLSPYAHLSLPGFLALGLVLPRVVPHLGGYCALGSLAEALTWGIPAVSAVAGFNSQALYQHILYWFGYRPNTMKRSNLQPPSPTPTSMELGILGHTLVYLSLFVFALLLLYLIKLITTGTPNAPERNSTLSQNIVIHKVDNSCADQGLDITLAYAQSFFTALPEDFNTSPKKINYVANQLEGPLRRWFAEVFQNEPEILLIMMCL